jgi:hypothetical protein
VEGGWGSERRVEVHLVDLATGVCTPGRPDMLRSRINFAAAGLPGGGIVCAGGSGGSGGSGEHLSSAEVWGPPVQGRLDAAWTWRQLPAMSVARYGCSGCVMSDGRFAVFGGVNNGGVVTSSCQALAIGDTMTTTTTMTKTTKTTKKTTTTTTTTTYDEHWEPLSPMHDPRSNFACATVAGCIIVAGGHRASAQVYDEVSGRWLRLPFNLPHSMSNMGSALL